VHTTLFDVGWRNAPHRVLRNSTVRKWEAAGRPRSGERPGEGELLARSPSRGDMVRYLSATPGSDTEGDIEALSLCSGQGVALVQKVQPTAEAWEVVRQLATRGRDAHGPVRKPQHMTSRLSCLVVNRCARVADVEGCL
jgi:nitronate monooxygenase